MIGKMVIEKSSMDINCFLYSIYVLAANGGKLSRYSFIREMEIFQKGSTLMPVEKPHDFREIDSQRTQYNKSKLPRYYGFINLYKTDTETGLVLTKRGEQLAKYLEVTSDEQGNLDCKLMNGEKKQLAKLIIESILYNSFGKNNCGVEQSSTDVELPKIVLKSVNVLGYVTAVEVLYIAEGMNQGNYGFDEAIDYIIKHRSDSDYYDTIREIVINYGRKNDISDCKYLNFFANTNLGILEKESLRGEPDKYRFGQGVKELYKNELNQLLPVYRPIQMILSGVPGTGKSYYVDNKILGGVSNRNNIIRVTIHPEYTYSDFIGYIVPKTINNKIKYEFSPGPLTTAIERALVNNKENIYLIIEEMNRGDFASIMGDTFQLLDRIDDFKSDLHGWSSYRIQNKSIYEYLNKKVQDLDKIFVDKKIAFPSNLNLIGTMNTADQNVFVLDTAFRRRFRNLYMKIDFSGHNIDSTGYLGNLDKLSKEHVFNGNHTWSEFAIKTNSVIDIINEEMFAIPEDKKFAPFFVNENDVSTKEAFVGKVINYLKNDVFKYTEDFLNLSFGEYYKKIVVENNDPYSLIFEE